LEAPLTTRYLGLDVGSKRIGVAVSDELGQTAHPVLTLTRKRNPKEDLRSLARLCRRLGCVGVVVGNPLHLSGESSAQGAKIAGFARELAKLVGLPLHLWDERLTSREAHEILYASGKRRQEHKPLVDQVAAVLILQSFLDAGSGSTRPGRTQEDGSEQEPEADPGGKIDAASGGASDR
jgi:putative Holliday junction resolvase